MFVRFARKSGRYFLVGILAAMGMILCDMLIPQIIRVTIDMLTGGGASAQTTVLAGAMYRILNDMGGTSWLHTHLWVPAMLIVLIALLGAFFRWLSTFENTRGGETLIKEMQDRLYEQIARLPFSWHMSHATGDIIQRCTSDVTMIKEFCAVQLYDLVRIVLMIVLALVFMGSMHIPLMLAAMAFFPVIVVCSLIFHNKVGIQFQQCDENEGVLSTIAQENLSGVRVVRAFGKEAAQDIKFQKQNAFYTELWMKLCRLLAYYWAFGDLASGLQVLTVVLLGAWFCVQGSLSLGSYLAFVSYNNMLVWPIRALGRMLSELSKSEVSLARIADIMDAQREQETVPVPGDASALSGGTKPFSQSQDYIRFEHVSFSFGENEVLKDVSFSVPRGATVGILGSTGCGKSTLMHLLCRLYELPESRKTPGEADSAAPKAGRIMLDGTDIRQIPLHELRKKIGIVLQEPFLFSRTVGENIRISGHADREEMERVTRIACLTDTIHDFPKGYDTIVGERGVTLSGGQRQRIAIARMLTEHTPVLIFDDSLSAVDAGTDVQIRNALEESLGTSTVFLISHRISTLMHADQIYVMEDGRILEHGTHEELVQADGMYARVFYMQASGKSETDRRGGEIR